MAERKNPPPPKNASPVGDPATGPARAARLRDAVDHGRTGDKVNYPDPAAAPLGTDDEAAGTPPTAEQMRMAERHEIARAQPAVPEPGAPRTRRPGMAQTLWWLLVVVVLLIVAAWIF